MKESNLQLMKGAALPRPSPVIPCNIPSATLHFYWSYQDANGGLIFHWSVVPLTNSCTRPTDSGHSAPRWMNSLGSRHSTQPSSYFCENIKTFYGELKIVISIVERKETSKLLIVSYPRMELLCHQSSLKAAVKGCACCQVGWFVCYGMTHSKNLAGVLKWRHICENSASSQG